MRVRACEGGKGDGMDGMDGMGIPTPSRKKKKDFRIGRGQLRMFPALAGSCRNPD